MSTLSSGLGLLLSVILFGCAGPAAVKKELRVDSYLSAPIEIGADILSSEPTIFVRGFSLEGNGAKDLDALLEKKLTAAGHRLTSRSVGAQVVLIARLVYLGDSAGIDIVKALRSGFKGEMAQPLDAVPATEKYEKIAVVDLEITTRNGEKEHSTVSRVVAAAQAPLPAITAEDLRMALLDRAARQVSVILDF